MPHLRFHASFRFCQRRHAVLPLYYAALMSPAIAVKDASSPLIRHYLRADASCHTIFAAVGMTE